MITKSQKKRKLILLAAEQVFMKKGFSSVTMKDIIEECNISRGGIYLYFSSVEEIFAEVLSVKYKMLMEQLELNVFSQKPFRLLIDDFFRTQKRWLLQMEGGMTAAKFEYFFSRSEKKDKLFLLNQFHQTKQLLLRILQYGASKNEIKFDDLILLAEHIMIFLEGLETLSMVGGVTEKIIDEQIMLIKGLIWTNERMK